METIFCIQELVCAIAISLNAQADVSRLGRCCRSLHASTISVLYRDIEFSIFKVDLIAETLRRNPSFSAHCQSLSITPNGQPQERQALAYDKVITENSPDYDSARLSREDILTDVAYVLDQCSAHGNLRHLSWILRVDPDLSVDWITQAFGDWRTLAWSEKTLQSFRYSEGGFGMLTVDKVSRHSIRTIASVTE